jgi:uroporphyrinogen III methyltransferase/synthase
VNATGFVTLVGAGPGDPDLITVAGRRALEEAQCVVYDRLVSPRLLELAPADAERVYVGKIGGRTAHCATQDSINAILIERAKKGLRVVRLKGGDPLLFGRGGEELEALANADVPFAVIPGVTAALAAGAFAGIPLTHRDDASAVAFVTGHEDPSKNPSLDPEALAKFPGTIAIYMPLHRSSAFAAALIIHGKPPETPVAFVEWASTNRQRTVETTLGELAHSNPTPIADLHSPALAIVGSVCTRRSRLRWFEKRPLFGQRLLILRPPHQTMELTEKFERLGAEAVSSPAFDILPPEHWQPVDSAISRLPEFSWIVFTSRNGVEMFLRRLWDYGYDHRAIASCRLAAIGPGTAAALQSNHLRADLVPDEFRAEALADSLGPFAALWKKILLVRADRGREVLERRLESVGEIEKVVAYRQVDREAPTDEAKERLQASGVDWVVFTSSNMARAFWRWKPMIDESAWSHLKFATISPVTSAAVKELGGTVAAEAAVYTMDGVVDAVRAAVTSSSA